MTAHASHEVVLSQLIELLETERQAIGTLDISTLNRISAEKTTIGEQLAQFVKTAIAPELQTRLHKARELAAANTLLLEDAQTAIAEALGIVEEPATYDRKARRHVLARTQPLVSVRSY